MDIYRLDQTVQQYYSATLTSSTHETYVAIKQWNVSIYLSAVSFQLFLSLCQEMCYATLLYVWAYKI